MEYDEFFTYFSESIYLYFPFFFTIFTGLVYLGFINCLYFNCCYWSCYRYKKTSLSNTNIVILFFLFMMATLIFMILGILGIIIYFQFITYSDEAFCQFANSNVLMVTSGINFTDSQNRRQIDSTINWSGLHFLQKEFKTYISDIVKLRNNLYNNKTLLGEIDPLIVYYQEIQNGIKQFIQFSSGSPFEITDPNGDNFPHYKLTYTCSSCQDTKTIIEAYQEINSTLLRLHNDLTTYRIKINNDFINDDGWAKTFNSLTNVYLEIKKDIYKSYKLYEIIENNYLYYLTVFQALNYFEFTIYFMNLVICVIGIWGISQIKNSVGFFFSKIANDLRIEHDIHRENNENNSSRQIKGRWTSHVVVNLNSFLSLFISIFAFMILLIAIFVFESSLVMRKSFYDSKKLKNFYYFPNGELIDTCLLLGNVNDRYNFSMFYKYYSDLIDSTNNLTKTYSNANLTATPKFNNLASRIKSYDLSQFHSKTNSSLKWDVNGEQINYFLIPLNQYKYITTKPTEVLIQFTDYSYVPSTGSSYTNKQKEYCPSFVTLDVWTDSRKTCETTKISDIATAISPIKANNSVCMNMDIKLSDTDCIFLFIPNCYVEYYMQRYTGELDFIDCNVPANEKMLSGSSEKYFQDKIESLLTYAKWEYILQTNMTDYLTNYKNNFINLIENKIINYKTQMQFILKFYSTLTPYYYETRKKLIEKENNTYTNGNLDKIGLMKISTCDWINTNSKVFYFVENILSETLFGLTIIYISMTIYLFIISSIALVIFFRLRTPSELLEISSNFALIKAIEDKERRFFFRDNVYIDSDDMIEMKLQNNDVSRAKNSITQNKDSSPDKTIINFLKKEEIELDNRLGDFSPDLKQD